MTRRPVVVIGVGNDFRRDDGVGPAVVAEIARRPGVAVDLVVSDGEPTQLLDSWCARELAIVVDAVLCEPSHPGRVHRAAVESAIPGSASSTHGLGIPEAVRLAQVLDRAPQRLVVYAVEAADLGFGIGLSARVAAAVAAVAEAAVAELAALA